jgi:hypothetical protein
LTPAAPFSRPFGFGLLVDDLLQLLISRDGFPGGFARVNQLIVVPGEDLAMLALFALVNDDRKGTDQECT